MMIAPYSDHELAVYQTVLFVDMRAGDSKNPQGPWVERKSKEEENVLKERVSKYHHFKDLDLKSVTSDTRFYFKVLVTQLCLTLCGTTNCSPPGSSVHRTV